jgi:prevent-host-death family protein
MTTVPLGDARDHLSEYVSDVERTHDRVVITRHGQPAAVLISPEELEGLEITIEALSDPETMKNVREAEAAIARGETYDESAVRAAFARRRAANA